MADFCSSCAQNMFGSEVKSDFNIGDIIEGDSTPPSQLELPFREYEPDALRKVLCEGCGWILVNREGTRIDGSFDPEKLVKLDLP